MTAIIVSVISGVLTLLGVCITAWASAKKTRDDVTAKLATAQAVTDCKLEELTREVRMHNDFARRIPVLEEKLLAQANRLGTLEQLRACKMPFANHSGLHPEAVSPRLPL